MSDFRGIVLRFRINGVYKTQERVGSGHINDSFRILTADDEHQGYLLQRINHHIFRDIPGLMSNIRQVTGHIMQKIASKDPAAEGLIPLMVIPATEGQDFIQDEDGNFWRMYNYITDAVSYDLVESEDLAYEGGRAFGTFQLLTSDLPAGSLIETIPGFHNIDFRLAQFREALENDPVQRAGSVQREIDFVRKRADEMRTILKLGKDGMIPLRVTHNDTKFNNILFNRQNRAVCIVDLDTVMPGYILYDFGDAIRTGANAASEDEQDLTRVRINMQLFKAYTKGYLSIASGFLNETEKDHLAFSARFMTFIIGLRFLTDHINGDQYYRIHRENHNLDRARVQFRLVESMEEHFSEMKEIVEIHNKKSYLQPQNHQNTKTINFVF